MADNELYKKLSFIQQLAEETQDYFKNEQGQNNTKDYVVKKMDEIMKTIKSLNLDSLRMRSAYLDNQLLSGQQWSNSDIQAFDSCSPTKGKLIQANRQFTDNEEILNSLKRIQEQLKSIDGVSQQVSELDNQIQNQDISQLYELIEAFSTQQQLNYELAQKNYELLSSKLAERKDLSLANIPMCNMVNNNWRHFKDLLLCVEQTQIAIEKKLHLKTEETQTSYSLSLIPRTLQIEIIKRMTLEEPILKHEHKQKEDCIKSHTSIAHCSDGNIVVAGQHQQLFVYSKDLTLLHEKDAGGQEITNILEHNQKLYCGTSDGQLLIISQSNFEIINAIQLQTEVRKVLLTNECLMIGQSYGCLDIIGVDSDQKIFSQQILPSSNINDIIRLNNDNDYIFAIASDQGINIFSLIVNIDGTITLIQNNGISYLDGLCVKCVVGIGESLLFAAAEEEFQVSVIDRLNVGAVQKIGQFDGKYNAIQKILKYDEETFPYIIVKDRSTIAIINTNTLLVTKVIPCQIGISSLQCSLVQQIIKGKLYILTLTDQTVETKGYLIMSYCEHFRTIQKFKIAALE